MAAKKKKTEKTTATTKSAPTPIQVGQHVTWTSGARGTLVTKEGAAVALLPSGADPIHELARAGITGLKPGQIRFTNAASRSDRVLVVVSHKAKRGADRSVYYAPNLRVLQGATKASKQAA